MKVQALTSGVETSGIKRSQPFKKLIEETKAELAKPARAPSVAKGSANVATPAKAVQTKQALHTQARTRVNAEAGRLTTIRAEHQEVQKMSDSAHRNRSTASAVTSTTQPTDTKFHRRVIERVMAELTLGDFNPADHTPPPIATVNPPELRSQAMSSSARLDATQASQAVELIEKVEVFMKSQRPALRLALNNSLGATVEIERLGPRRVALKLVGNNGLPSASVVSQLREELRARGLEVGALSIL